jgi:hypothetical protein
MAEKYGGEELDILTTKLDILQKKLPLLWFLNDIEKFLASDYEGSEYPIVITMLIKFLRYKNNNDISFPRREFNRIYTESNDESLEKWWAKRIVQYWVMLNEVKFALKDRYNSFDDVIEGLKDRLVNKEEKKDIKDLFELIKDFYNQDILSNLFKFIKQIISSDYNIVSRIFIKMINPHINDIRIKLRRDGISFYKKGDFSIIEKNFKRTFIELLTRRTTIIREEIIKSLKGINMNAIGKERGRTFFLGQTARIWWNLINIYRNHEFDFTVLQDNLMKEGQFGSSGWGYTENGYNLGLIDINDISSKYIEIESKRTGVSPESFELENIINTLKNNPNKLSQNVNFIDQISEIPKKMLIWNSTPDITRTIFINYIIGLKPRSTQLDFEYYNPERPIETISEIQKIGSDNCIMYTIKGSNFLFGIREYIEIMYDAISYSSVDKRQYFHPKTKNNISLDVEDVEHIILIILELLLQLLRIL